MQRKQHFDETQDAVQAFKHSVIITGLNGAGNFIALLADVVIAARYGLGTETDAFFVAITVPQLISSLLLVSFNVTLVPIFSAVMIKDGKGSLWRFCSNLMNICFVVLAVLGVAGALLSTLLISVIAPGLNPETSRLASKLSVLLFMMIIPLGTTEVMKAALNALHSFAPPASSNLLRNSAVVVIVWSMGGIWGIKAIAIGYIFGYWLQLVVIGMALIQHGYRYTARFNLREQQVRETWRLLRLPLFGGAINLSNTLIERFLVSFLSSGAVSALAYARRILSSIDSIFIGSVATAFLPRLSKQLTRRDLVAYRHYLTLGLKLSLFIAIPMTTGVIALSVPAVRLFFQRGAFDQTATHNTAMYLSLYMLGIPASAAMQILVAGFYADLDTVTPFYLLVTLLAVTAIFDVVFFMLIEAQGLALGLSLAKLIIAVRTYSLLHRRVGQMDKGLGRFTVKVIAAALAMAAGIYLTGQLMQMAVAANNGQSPALLNFASGAAVGVAIFVASAFMLRIEEVTQLTRLVRQHL